MTIHRLTMWFSLEGSALSLSNPRLNNLLAALKRPNRILRIGTRHPTTLPQRITPELCYHPQRARPYLHHDALQSSEGMHLKPQKPLTKLADAGCVLSNQTVLLKGINDNAQTLQTLNKWLVVQSMSTISDCFTVITHKGWVTFVYQWTRTEDYSRNEGTLKWTRDPRIRDRFTQWTR